MSCRVLGRLISNTSILRPWPSAPVSINRNTHALYDAPAGSDPAGHTDLVPTPPISGHSHPMRLPLNGLADMECPASSGHSPGGTTARFDPKQSFGGGCTVGHVAGEARRPGRHQRPYRGAGSPDG